MTQEYRIQDVRDISNLNAAVAVADLPWARPQRNGVHVTYPTFGPDEIWDFVDAIMDSLQSGGYALFDADDWFLPRLITHLQSKWGDAAKDYRGGGYRRVGSVVYDGHPGAGHYFTNGGYHVVFAHKNETDRESRVSSKQIAKRPNNNVEWGTQKPVKPYRKWVTSVMDKEELLYVPTAGTAPAAIGLLREWGNDANFICVDSEPDAKKAFERRRGLL